MELIEIFKALSNPTRLEILKGLKDPVKNFPPQDEGDVLTVGVCVSSIQEGIGLSQSTVSGYLQLCNEWAWSKSGASVSGPTTSAMKQPSVRLPRS